MTRIDFDEPSKGDVNSDENALEINQTGGGGAIMAKSKKNIGIIAEAGSPFGERGIGIHATAYGENAIAIEGKADKGTGIKGSSNNHVGILGSGKEAGVSGRSIDPDGVGVSGESDFQAGVFGKSLRGKIGVHGECRHVEGAGVQGTNNSTAGGIGVLGIGGLGIGILGRGKLAGRFEGDVEVTGDIKLVNADCAEDFDICDSVANKVEPGTVMVLTETGSLQPSYKEYDKRVAGIVSGAKGYKPAIVLDREYQTENKENRNNDRLPIALMGKVYCKVDATEYSIVTGDLLTTSSTEGYAMKAKEPARSFGAVIGKALGSLNQGTGMIPVLVTLQ